MALAALIAIAGGFALAAYAVSGSWIVTACAVVFVMMALLGD